MMYSRILAIAIIIGATLWIGSGVLGRTEEPASATTANAAAVQPLFKVAFTEARPESHSRVLVISGRTEADNKARAVSRAMGSIVELRVRRGDGVEEGDVIATLSDEARGAQVTQAEALLAQSRIDLEAKLKLIDRGVLAANEKSRIESDMRAAEAALALAKAENERGQIRAPISGVVSDVPVTTGQPLEMNEVVAEIVALNPMLAVAEVAERQLGDIQVGDRAEASLVTGDKAAGTVRFISPTASAGTRTYRVEVMLDNDEGLIPDGVTAEIAFQLKAVEAVRIPRSALTFSTGGELSVRVVQPDDTIATVPVAIIEDAREEVWISGPQAVARIVVQGQDFVKDGQRVEPVAVDAAPAPLISSS
jgi:membrane fusion protein, multidrug efflux system